MKTAIHKSPSVDGTFQEQRATGARHDMTTVNLCIARAKARVAAGWRSDGAIVPIAQKPARRAGAAAIYFIREGDSGPVKIGAATNVPDRLATLQTAHHATLRLLATMPGDQRQERQLHARFAHLKIRGEWFKPGEDLLAFIGALPL